MLQDFVTGLEKSLYGMTKDQAVGMGICLNCKEQVFDPLTGGLDNDHFYSEVGKKEYFISGLCEKCFDKITGGE